MRHSRNKLLIFSLAIVLIPISVLSQKGDSLATITGTVEVVKDSTDLFFSPPNVIENYPHALPSTNITLMRSDSTFVTGATSGYKRGQYKIKNIKPGNYIIKAMYVGYGSKSEAIQLTAGQNLKKDIELGHIFETQKLPFGAAEARKDIQNGVVEIRTYPTVGCCFMCDEEIIKKKEDIAKELRKRYGFTRRSIEEIFDQEYDSISEKLRQAIIRYNTVVKQHLAEINGADWQKRYRKELRQAEKRLIQESQN